MELLVAMDRNCNVGKYYLHVLIKVQWSLCDRTPEFSDIL